MTRMSADDLKAELARLIDPALADLLVTTYLEMQQRYYAGDWQPAELDGGRFCEAAARATYQVDSGTVSHSKLPADVAAYLLDLDRSGRPLAIPHSHNLNPKDRSHFCRVLQTVYKFRSDRGAVHISPLYSANHLDASMVVANVKWLFAEFLRFVWNKDRIVVGTLIESIIELEHPLVHEVDGEPLVLSGSLSAPEEVLALLRHADQRGLTRESLRRLVRANQQAIDMAIRRLEDRREIRLRNNGDFIITPLGVQRVRDEIVPKLSESYSRALSVNARTRAASRRTRVPAARRPVV